MSGDAAVAPRATLLADYRPADFLVDRVRLEFDLDEHSTRVRSVMQIRRSPTGAGRPLELDGQQLELDYLALDDGVLGPGDYELDANRLRLADVPDVFLLEVASGERVNVSQHPDYDLAPTGVYRAGP